jgi:anthranilate phosphoribosyltransferase
VALNTAALLMTAGKAVDLREGVGLALETIGRGHAKRLLDRFIEATRAQG